MKRHYTLRDNVRSACIGMGLGLMTVPFMIAEREGRDDIGIPYVSVVYAEPRVDEVTEIAEVETMVVVEPAEVAESAEFVEAEISVPEEKEPYFPYTQEDIYLVGNTVFWEVGNLRYRCTEEDAMKALRMTASCVVNRAKMNYKYLGRTIESQVYVSSQYQSWQKITNTKQSDVDEIFYQIAEEILQNGSVVSERLVFQSEDEQGEVVAHIDNQYFGIVPEPECEAYKNAD